MPVDNVSSGSSASLRQSFQLGEKVLVREGQQPPKAPPGTAWQATGFRESLPPQTEFTLVAAGRPAQPRTQVTAALHHAITDAWQRGSFQIGDAQKMVDAARAGGTRDIDVSVLHRLVVNRGPFFTPEAARHVRLYLMNDAGIPGD